MEKTENIFVVLVGDHSFLADLVHFDQVTETAEGFQIWDKWLLTVVDYINIYIKNKYYFL